MIVLLTKIPPSAWIAICTAILTSGLTLTGVWLTNKSNNRRLEIQLEHERLTNEKEIKRERLEDLYVLSNKYFATMGSSFLPFRMVMEGRITYNQALDLEIETLSKTEYDPHRVPMLIALYFQDLSPSYNGIMKINDDLHNIIGNFKEHYKRGDVDGSEWLERFKPLCLLLDQRFNDFNKKMAQIKIE